MKTIATLIFVLFIGVTAQAQTATEEVKVNAVEMTIITETAFDEVTFGVLPPPTCDDGMQNGNETDVDCGGPDCDDCPPLPKPMVSAPDPTPLPSEVINKYSDFYNPGLVDGVQVNNWFGCNVETILSIIFLSSSTLRIAVSDFHGFESNLVTAVIFELSEVPGIHIKHP